MKSICCECGIEYESITSMSKYCSNTCKGRYRRKNNDCQEFQFILRYVKKIKAINYLGGKCEICNDSNIFHLCFHHGDEVDKESTISSILNNSWGFIKEELNKCNLFCNNCHREFHHNINKKLKYGNYRRDSKDIFVNYKGNKCEKCGYDKCNSSLHFHHENEDKLFWIGSNSKKIESIEDLENKLIVELDKCKLLCSNCHQEEHSDIEKFNKLYDKIIEKLKTYKEHNRINYDEVYDLYFIEKLRIIEISKKLNIPKSSVSEYIKKLRKI